MFSRTLPDESPKIAKIELESGNQGGREAASFIPQKFIRKK
jgi:hypothetical protein